MASSSCPSSLISPISLITLLKVNKELASRLIGFFSLLSSLKEANLKNSIEKYHRLIFLNNYIEQKFKDKSKNIPKKNFENIQNSLSKN